MQRAAMLLLLIFGLSSLAFAGKIYGSITEGGKPVAPGVKVEVTCGEKSYSAPTDAYGSFKLFVPDKGKCTLKVYYQGQAPSFEISSYEGSVQYDLILEKAGTQYTLRRK
ncbi:MAG: carboxypeptidase-like regulatory domain-containing protein [Acidobacteriia bacterium]|nr:carboxypeptidase-like regulatory domain-containing protein [Terriglobia bacterium]